MAYLLPMNFLRSIIGGTKIMDKSRKGYVTLNDVAQFGTMDIDSEFFRRHFGEDGRRYIGYANFSEFLVDYGREMGRQ
jgi:hypothetical protein